MKESLGTIPPMPILVWKHILDCLRYDSRPTIQALNLVCRGFRRLALPILFETIHIHFFQKSDSGIRMLEKLQEAGHEMLNCVRTLIVSGSFNIESSEEYPPAFVPPLLVSLVEKLSGLRVLRWRGRFPLPYGVQQNLDARQPVPGLYFEGWSSNLPNYNFLDAPVKYYTSHCIRSLSIVSFFAEALDEIKNILFMLPSLDRLDMIYRQAYNSEQKVAPLFSLGPGDSIPSLRTLCLTNFTVDLERVNGWDRRLRLKHLGLDGNSESLEILSLFTTNVPDLTSLALRIHDASSRHIAHDLYSRLEKFLQSVNALKGFTAYDLSKDIIPLLVSCHGSHLRRLRFRQTNFNKGYRELEKIRCIFTFEELQSLASELPRLQVLGFDLKFKGHLSYDILSGVACFPSLEHLELNTDFPLDHHTPFVVNGRRQMVHSWINEAVVEETICYVAGEKRYYQRIAGSTKVPWSPFMALDVKVGEWEPTFEEYRSSLYCTVANPLSVYACRWVSCYPGKVDIVRLKSHAVKYPIEIDLYERALAYAGLTSISKVLSGPGALY